jgi:3-hydroxybutyryl-CoA dehydratase
MNEFDLADLFVGFSIEKTCDIEANDILAFADFSGDWSSVHMDKEYALARGFDGCLVHGLLIGGLISGFIGMVLPGKHGLLQMINLQFRDPTYVPDRLTIRGTVNRVSEATMTAVIDLRVIGEDGRERVRGQANSVLKS